MGIHLVREALIKLRVHDHLSQALTLYSLINTIPIYHHMNVDDYTVDAGKGGRNFAGSASLRGHSDWVNTLGGSKNMTMGGGTVGGGPAK